MEIRCATLQDIDSIQQLYPTLFHEMAALQPDFFRGASQDETFVTTIIQEQSSDILLAEQDGQLLGFALIQQQTTPPYNCLVPHRYTFVMDLLVAPHSRSKGVGKQLMDGVRQWSKEKGCEYIELNVLSNNVRAIEFYQREQFKPYLYTLRTEL